MFSKLPYPGLRPFYRNEADIFFGREEQVDDLLRKLNSTRFLSVIGPSGCGKSSLVRAGLIAALETGFMAQAGANWRTVVMRPGSHPLQRLAEALMEESALGPERSGQTDALSYLEATLRRGPLGLVEALKESPLPKDTNLILLVDQFEEIFRFRNEIDMDEADAFVALLLETAAQCDLPIYVVITMRSEYLGDCAVFTSLPETLNNSQYLTPRLSRDQRRAAIVGPARVFGGEIDADLVNKLLNETGTDPNQLPVLQHLLMRMWECTQAQEVDTLAHFQSVTFFEDFSPDAIGHKLTMADYERVGGLKNALSNHADEAFDSLDKDQQIIGEFLFRSLCERGQDRRDCRRPTAICDIASRAGVSDAEVIAIVEVFRDTKYEFLLPAPPEPLFNSKVIDISHESLINNWQRLSLWVEEEAESAETYRNLEYNARLWKTGQAALWETPNLENALIWKQSFKPSPEWAERYGGNFPTAMEFLSVSKKEHDQKRKATLEIQLKKLQRAKFISVSLALLLLLSCFGTWLGFKAYVWEYEAFYNNYEKRFGIPEGIGELTEEQLNNRAVSLKIIKKGWKGPVISMEAVNNQGLCTPDHNIGTYVKPEVEGVDIKRECRWEYVLDNKGHIMYENMYDQNENLVKGFVYTPKSNKQTNIRDGYYVGPDGYPKPQTASELNFVSFKYNEEGDEILQSYFDRNHTPIPGPDKAFAREQEFDERGFLVKMTSLDGSGKPMNDEAGNASLVLHHDELGNVLEGVAYDAEGNITLVIDGWAIAKFKYNTSGNKIEEKWYDSEGKPTLHKSFYHLGKYHYDNDGNQIQGEYFGIDGKPILTTWDLASWKAEYNKKGKPAKMAYFNIYGKWNIKAPTEKMDYDEKQQLTKIVYVDNNSNPIINNEGYASIEYQYDDSNLIAISYFGVDGKSILIDSGYQERSLDAVSNKETSTGYHKEHRHYEQGRETTRTYLDLAGNPVNIKQGYAEIRKKYDYLGNIIEEAYFDRDGKHVTLPSGYHAIKRDFDNRGNNTITTYLDQNSKPIILDGYAREISEYNDFGKETLVRYDDGFGKPVIISSGYTGWKAEYNDHGDRISLSYFNKEERLIMTDDGYASLTYKYDNFRKIIEKAYFDDKNNAILSKDGYAFLRYNRDKYGNKLEGAYYGTDGKLTLHPGKGYAKWTAAYNDIGKQVDGAYYGTDNNLILHPEYGYAHWTAEYDDNGNRLGDAVYGTDERLMFVADLGYARRTALFDDRGKQTQEAFYNADNKLVLHPEYGYAKWTAAYDDNGNRIDFSAYGIDDKLIMVSEYGIARRTAVFNERGNQVEEAYFNADNKPMLHPRDGYAKWTNTFDDKGKLIDQVFYNTEGKLIYLPEFGYAKHTAAFDDNGKPTDQAFYNADGQLMIHPEYGYAKYTIAYDDKGRQTGGAYYGADGKLMIHPNYGYAQWKSSYDDNGNWINEAVYGIDEHLIFVSDLGYARRTAAFGDHGKQIEEAYYGADNKLLLHSEYGYAKWTSAYDDNGKQIDKAYYGADSKLMHHPEYGYAKWTAAYDDNGKQIDEAFYGADGSLILHPSDGYARFTTAYDDQGQLIDAAFYGADGKLMHHPEYSYARLAAAYDDKGRQIDQAFYSADNKLMIHPKYGFARYTFAYNDNGKQIYQAYYGTDDKLMLHPEYGYAKWTSTYDGNGRQVDEAFYGANGQLMLHPTNGYARFTSAYNDQGQLIDGAFYGADGKLIIHSEYGYARYLSTYDDIGNKVEESYYGGNDKLLMQPFAYAKLKIDYQLKLFTSFDEHGNKIQSIGFSGAELSGKSHVFITGIFPDSQASKIELQLADIVFRYDGIDITNTDQLIQKVSEAGEQLRELVIIRQGKKISIKVSPGKLGIQLLNVNWEY